MLSMIIQFIVLSCNLLFITTKSWVIFIICYHNSWVIAYYFVGSYLGGNSLITPRNTMNKTQGNFPLVAARVSVMMCDI